MAEKCCKRIYGGSFTGHPCGKTAKVNEGGKWYCATHSTEAYAKREAKRKAQWDEKVQAIRESNRKERIDATKLQLFDDLLSALKDARYWIASADDKHDGRCAFICNKGGPCDCPVPMIDAALARAEGK